MDACSNTPRPIWFGGNAEIAGRHFFFMKPIDQMPCIGAMLQFRSVVTGDRPMFDVETCDPSVAAKDAAAHALRSGGLESVFRTDSWADEELQQFVDLLHANLLASSMKIDRIDCSAATSRKLGFEGRDGVGFYTPAPGYTIPVFIEIAPTKSLKVTIRSTTERRVVRWN